MRDRVYSSSSSDSDSGSGSESELDMDMDMGDILKGAGVGMSKKYGKVFAKAKVEDLDDARQLTERGLKKMGISSSTDRKKILKAIAQAKQANSDSESSSSASSGTSSSSASSDFSSDSESDSDSDADEAQEVEKTLKKHGLKKYYSKLKKHKVTSLKAAKKLSDRKLREIGFDSSTTRKKLLTAFSDSKATTSKLKRSGSSGSNNSRSSSKSKGKSSSSSGSKKDEKKIIARVLSKAGLATVALKFEEHNIDTLDKARALSPNRLKSMGIDTLSSRCTILDAFKNSKNLSSYPSQSSSDSETESETSRRSRGSKGSKSKSKSSSKSSKKSSKDDKEGSGSGKFSKKEIEENNLLKALTRVNLEKHYDLFVNRDVADKSIRQLQELGHNELRDIGIENAGQRSMIMEAISEADWKCVYCQTWNEHRKTCVVCQKTFRKVSPDVDEDGEKKFAIDDKVKYVGRFRPTTRIKYGEKGVVHRVLEGEFYMVKFTNKEKKTVAIRLQQNELTPIK